MVDILKYVFSRLYLYPFLTDIFKDSLTCCLFSKCILNHCWNYYFIGSWYFNNGCNNESINPNVTSLWYFQKNRRENKSLSTSIVKISVTLYSHMLAILVGWYFYSTRVCSELQGRNNYIKAHLHFKLTQTLLITC